YNEGILYAEDRFEAPLIRDSYSSSKVMGNEKVGGLVGKNSGGILTSYSTGYVKGDSNQVGGLVGRNHDGFINNSYSSARVVGGVGAGGLVAVNSISKEFYMDYYGVGIINNSYSRGLVSGESHVGGLLGWNNGSTNSCFWDIETSGQTSSAEGTGKTSIEMKTKSTFTDAGWDFNNIWDMNLHYNDGYAFLDAGDYVVFLDSNTCSFDENIIMKLDKPGNAYGALWNGSYDYSICYEDIFNSDGGVGAHACTGSNKAVGLSDAVNSYAEIPSLDNYPIDVCYGDLFCTARDNACLDDEKMVVALYNETNSYITDANYMPSGGVSWWKLDKDAEDAIGSNDGEVNNVEDVLGKIGQAMAFNRTQDSWIKINDSSDFHFDDSSFSLEAWVKPDSYNNEGSLGVGLLTRYDGRSEDVCTGNRDFVLSVAPANLGDKFRFGFSYDGSHWGLCRDGEKGVDVNTKEAYKINEWNHVVGVYDLQEGKILIYLNGKLSNSVQASQGPCGSDCQADVYIGSLITREQGYSSFNGTIDEAVIYNKALSAGEIQTRYYRGLYEKKICCSSEDRERAQWIDTNKEKISEAEINESVSMVVYSGNNLLTENLTYRVYKGNELLDSLEVKPYDTNFSYIEWQIPSTLNLNDQLYFKVNISGTVEVSNNLTIIKRDDTKTTINILEPHCGTIINQSDKLNIIL
ncbi:MAG: LamG domain-containing protein, partial [Candidatus Nanoarchaeia archaeon]